ncbi:sialic acid-binding Ig-like lectin 12 [Labeo rohita]|uniref:sialic acid-binding Ig-like lectin 12 n=1 Tax=Labeo rohita TaxID=84645 RepID=UPI0021E2B70C|nr:sialic acid-binding Ig-like lectin 12 [Labeo rohita]
MKLTAVQHETCLVLIFVLQLWIGSSNGLLLPGGDYDFELRLEKSFITAAAGCAQIPCAFTIPVRVYPVQKIWFRGSPEFPLSPPMVEEQANLMWPLRSPEHECSIILWDFSGHERIEEYGLMLKWGTNETHIYDERITVSYSTAKLNISLNTEALVAGQQTYIYCRFPDLCLGSYPKVTWTGLGSKKHLDVGYPRKMNNYLIYSQQLLYTAAPRDHQAEITCEATFGKNLSANGTMTLTVHSHPQILNSSACSLQKVLLTCVCVSQGVPLPDIHWPLQSNADSNIVRTSDGHITVRSTYTMTVEDLTSISSPVCVSKNKLGQTKMTLPVNINKVKEAA